MAININTNAAFVGRITPVDANYPYASSKDETAPGAGDGSPYLKVRADDIFGFNQALLRLASIVPTGNAETALASQYLQSLIELAQGRATNYDDSGVADAYVLDVQTNQQAPGGLFDGQEFEFIVGNTNAGASTVNAVGTGVKAIVNTANGGELPANARRRIKYRLASDNYEIVTPSILNEFVSAGQTLTAAGSLTLAHGLPAAPKLIQARLICTTAEHNYSINDELMISLDEQSSSSVINYGMSVVPDATNINVRFGSNASIFLILDKTTGAGASLTPGRWELIVRAWS